MSVEMCDMRFAFLTGRHQCSSGSIRRVGEVHLGTCLYCHLPIITRVTERHWSWYTIAEEPW